MDKIDKDKNGSVTFVELKDWIRQRSKKWVDDDAERLWKFIKEISHESKNLSKAEKLVAEKTVDMDAPIKWEEYKWSKFRGIYCLLYDQSGKILCASLSDFRIHVPISSAVPTPSPKTFCHITPLLRELHLLPLRQRITFK